MKNQQCSPMNSTNSISKKRYIQLLGSYKLSVIALLFLLIVVLLGTLAQTEKGIYEVQKKYFTSLFLVHWLFNIIPIPLPGGGLLLFVILINLFTGGIILAPKSIKRPGMLIAHAGAILLIIGGFWGHIWGKEGLVSLFEGEKENSIESPQHWEIYIWQLDENSQLPIKEWTISEKQFSFLKGGLSKTFSSNELPFKLTLMRYYRNAEPHLAVPGAEGSIQGVYLAPLNPEIDEEKNLPGIYAEISSHSGNQIGLLWGGEKYPWVVKSQEKTFAIGLRRAKEPLPFTIQLLKFTKEFYPRTTIPKFFSSEVICKSNTWEQRAIIKMNEPLRFMGYTIYQASWGTIQTLTPEGTKHYSVLAISKNPAEQIPLISCIIISGGLLIHFTQKLFHYIRTAL